MQDHHNFFHFSLIVGLLLTMGLTTGVASSTFTMSTPIKLCKSSSLTTAGILTGSIFQGDTTLPYEAQRESITFIMGEDRSENNPYYALALNYYQNNPAGRTEYLVTTCRSLQEIRDYLEMHPPSDHQPWGIVNIVLHSNEWSGIDASVFPDGPRATARQITKAATSGTFKSLSDTLMDEQSEIILYACGLGNNAKLLRAISLAFGGTAQGQPRPIVRSSKQFILYNSEDNQLTQRYLANYWYAFYKTGYRQGDIRLSRQLKKRYPEAPVDWRDALTRTQPRWPGDLYHYTFRIPISWVVTFANASDRPDLSSAEAQEAFLQEQTELLKVIEQYGIPKDKFRWQFKKINYTFEDGTTEPAIKIKGDCTILSVLQAITKTPANGESSFEPLVPDLNDERYYTSEQP